MTQHVVRPEVAAFVAQVRSCLSDLSPDEVEELSGGLEADLDERLADSLPGARPADLGDPASYAAELRAAAGLPPRGARGGRRGPGAPRRAVRAAERSVRAAFGPLADGVRRQPWWPETRASVVALRPAWWLARAWVAFQVVTGGGWLPSGFGGLVLLLLFVSVSVALGRGLLDARLGLVRTWLRRALVALNALAVVLLPVAVAGAGPLLGAATYSSEESAPHVPGLALDGVPVRNVYAYDAHGDPIPLVQLYDQDGRPIGVAPQEWVDEFGTRIFSEPTGGQQVAPWVDDRGQGRWNAFPVPNATYPAPEYDVNGNPRASAPPTANVPPAPIVAVPPVVGVYGVPSSGSLVPGASPSPTPTGSPSDGPTTSPSPGASASSKQPSATRTP